MTDVAAIVKDWILTEILPGEDPDQLQPDTSLKEDGILDSMATLRLVDFLETQFSIRLEPRDLDGDSLETIAAIEALVAAKSG
jgi:acyl carrier protein